MQKLPKNMGFRFKLFWSDEAVRNLEEILCYLEEEWSQKEVNNFKSKLSRQLSLITQNPKLFPLSDYNTRLRRAVLSKHTTIFYELANDSVYLVYLFNNRQDIHKIEKG